MLRAVIKINGIVQGVGFRPFINKLVKNFNLKGWVKNTSLGVELEVEGEEKHIKNFIDEVINNPPKLAFIEDLQYEFFKELKYYKGFEIIKSQGKEDKFTFISPDVSICDDCLNEMFDKENRRYLYPFINCTNCGPRFTIIKDIPYDRDKTTMKKFKMCQQCSSEYLDIDDRRYHAQPNCCRECGPKVYFIDKNKEKFDKGIEKAIEYLKDGKIIAIKGIGGFHVACDAKNKESVLKLRQRKGRDEKPFALMMRDINVVENYCYLDKEEKKILESYKRPITLLAKKNNILDHVSENKWLGVMLPYSPLHYLLMQEFDVLVMTSGNIHDVPIVYKNDEAISELWDIVDGFLVHDRDIHVRCDDSIVKVFEGKEYFIRRSRGYVPFPIRFESSNKVLACGAEQKGSFALSKNGFAFLSQHIGELRNAETYKHYIEQIEHFKKLFDIDVERIACDMHPDYLSTQYAKEISKSQNLPLYMVQHHHAHMASCMADNKLEGEVIGIIWDGTGYGLDGKIWGGEFLVGGYKEFKRVATIRDIALPGGDRAIKDVYRIKYSLLIDALGEIPKEFATTDDLDVINMMLNKNFNTIKASSIGRLFDGVASIMGIKDRVSYEGQAAILLESKALNCDKHYNYELYNEEILKIDWRPIIKDVVKDVTTGESIELIASSFMNTLVKSAVDVVLRLRDVYNIDRVVISGGVFQNIYLLSKLVQNLRNNNFKVYYHNRVATNDEGIALGQLAVAENEGGILCV